MGSVQSTSRSSGEDDEALLARLAAGDQEALGPLYSRYAGMIFAQAVTALDATAAEEVVQDVLLAVWRAAGTFDPARGTVRPWIMQIARFRIVNELRRKRRVPAVEPDPEGIRLFSLPDPDPDPAEQVVREENRVRVREALDRLPQPQREALGLAFLGGLTHEEVADTLNLPLGTAKTRIRAGIQKLRVALAPMVAAAVVLLGGVAAILGLRVHQNQQEAARDRRALFIVTGSESTVLRATAVAGFSAPEAHATYAGRPGYLTAVVHLGKMPPAPQGMHYQVWVRHGDSWLSLGMAHVDSTGIAVMIVEGIQEKELPDAFEVTLESSGNTVAPGDTLVLSWTAQPRP